MANYVEISETTKELFDVVLKETSIPTWVNFELIGDDSQKEVYVIKKLTDLIERISNGLNFIVIINEEIFEKLEEEQQKMLLFECLNGVVVDIDKDKISLEKPNFTTYSSLLVKFGHEEIIRLKESISSFYEEKKQREDEEKAITKKKKQND